jgi:hypothetical protein
MSRSETSSVPKEPALASRLHRLSERRVARSTDFNNWQGLDHDQVERELVRMGREIFITRNAGKYWGKRVSGGNLSSMFF